MEVCRNENPNRSPHQGPARGARASSWARFEEGKFVGVALRAYRLDGRPGSRKFGGIVETTASVVVASKTSEDLSHANELAVVPYGDGELTIQRAGKGQVSAQAMTHYFDGSADERCIEIHDGLLPVPLRESNGKDHWVEWIELNIQSE